MENHIMPTSCRPPWPVPHPMPPSVWPAEVLRLGDRDSDVKELQRALRALGYGLTIDGRFGRATQECVRSFQATHGLPRDGIVGERTWGLLRQHCQEVMRDE